MTFLILFAIYWIVPGAIWGRVDGGGIAKVSEWVERTFVMLPFLISTAVIAGPWCFTAYSGVAAIATGHGQYFLARMIKYVKPEFFDFLVRPFFGADPRSNPAFKNFPVGYGPIEEAVKQYGRTKLYWRCVFGMFVTGTLLGLPAFVLCMVYQKWYGALFLLTGIVKALSYMIAYAIFKDTKQAEYINGALRNTICLGIMLYSI